MTTFAIIPVKRVDEAKSRLASVLLDKERKEFCLKMLEDVLTTVETTRNIDQTVVVGGEQKAFQTAKRFDAEPLVETRYGLNKAVSEAITWCIQEGATSTLVLPADIPLVTPTDLNKILSSKEKGSVVISPSRSGEGTNALLLTPPNIIPTFYGPHSFRQHVKEANVRGVSLRTLRLLRIALDIDTVEDLAYFASLKPRETRSQRFLERIRVLERLSANHKGHRK